LYDRFSNPCRSYTLYTKKIVLVINMGIRVKALYEECFEAFGVAGFGGEIE
jgi:hypothetical protein